MHGQQNIKINAFGLQTVFWNILFPMCINY